MEAFMVEDSIPKTVLERTRSKIGTYAPNKMLISLLRTARTMVCLRQTAQARLQIEMADAIIDALNRNPEAESPSPFTQRRLRCLKRWVARQELNLKI
jgi:hypothetical protein